MSDDPPPGRVPLAPARVVSDRMVLPPPPPYVPPPYVPPPRHSGPGVGAGRALGILGIVIVTVIRVAMITRSTTPSFSYTPPKLDLDWEREQQTLQMLQQMERDPAFHGAGTGYAPYTPSALPPPPPRTRAELVVDLENALQTLDETKLSPRQRARYAAMRTAAHTGDCKKTRAAWSALSIAPGRDSDLADTVDAVNGSIADLCDTPATPPTP